MIHRYQYCFLLFCFSGVEESSIRVIVISRYLDVSSQPCLDMSNANKNYDWVRTNSFVSEYDSVRRNPLGEDSSGNYCVLLLVSL